MVPNVALCDLNSKSRIIHITKGRDDQKENKIYQNRVGEN